MSIILSLAGKMIPNELTWAAYRQVIRISGKDAIRIFGTRSGRGMGESLASDK
jgi:hypothetical protein